MLFNFASDCRIGKKFEEKCLDRNSSDSSTCIPTYHRYRGSFVRKQCEDIVAENLMLLSQSGEYVFKKKEKNRRSKRTTGEKWKIVQWPITAGIFTDDLTPLTFVLQRSSVTIVLSFQESTKKREGSDERKIKKRREKLAWDLVEISCPDICMWSLTAGFTEKEWALEKRRKTPRWNYRLSISFFYVCC